MAPDSSVSALPVFPASSGPAARPPAPRPPAILPSVGEVSLRALRVLREQAADTPEGHRALANLARLLRDKPWHFLQKLPMPLTTTREDLSQDILLKLLRSPDSFQGDTPGQALNWLRSMAQNHVRDLFRRADALRKLARLSLDQAVTNSEGDSMKLSEVPPDSLVVHRRMEDTWKLQLVALAMQKRRCGLSEAQAEQARFFLDHALSGISTEEQLRQVLGAPPRDADEERRGLNQVYQRRRQGKLALTALFDELPLSLG